MKAFFSYLLIALVLLQTFSREVLLVDFALNRTAITARYCVNKARPRLHCDGKCYFAKLAKKQEQRESKAPSLQKGQLEMLPASTVALVPRGPVVYAQPVCYGRPEVPAVPSLGLRAVFHPPQQG